MYKRQEQDVLLVLMLNQRGRLLKETYLFQGTVNASVISPREIFLEALSARAVQIILLHNQMCIRDRYHSGYYFWKTRGCDRIL